MATEQAVRLGAIGIGEDRLLTSRPIFGDRTGADQAFRQYATQFHPDEFSRMCAPDAYESGSVLVVAGYVWTEACGELWAQLADDAAAWVVAGQADPEE